MNTEDLEVTLNSGSKFRISELFKIKKTISIEWIILNNPKDVVVALFTKISYQPKGQPYHQFIILDDYCQAFRKCGFDWFHKLSSGEQSYICGAGLNYALLEDKHLVEELIHAIYEEIE